MVGRHALLCLRTKPSLRGTQISFLRNLTNSNPAPLQFYWSVWAANGQLDTCSITHDPTIVRHYLSGCHGHGGTDNQKNSDLRHNISLLFTKDSPCQLRPVGLNHITKRALDRSPSNKSGARVRQKRAWVFPGTLWCGRGSSAKNYEQLGMFERADQCCREHDYCSSTIRSFSMNFGVFNPRPFTVSHCDCDHRFQQCLLDANDTVSNMVGYSFFNLLKIPCFDLVQEKRCTQLSWWGRCTSAQVAPLAVLRNPKPYTPALTSTPPDDQITVRPSTKRRCSHTEPPRGDNFLPHKKGRSCKKKGSFKKEDHLFTSTAPLLQQTSPLQTLPLPTQREIPSAKSTESADNKNTPSRHESCHKGKGPAVIFHTLGIPEMCEVVRTLDNCKYKIQPQERRYGYHNTESTTIYHCDCTLRSEPLTATIL
ncbi:group 3 secretory phospholipase A2 [Chanos chanos]|uniref:phospholipase A2 n=1 Tax=Chanos chanos TaxID=29144 RepID=A0A6J2UU42_CHACN|nr:group 3 secretory phospholipase A2-like [Chanos chanos]